MFDKGASFLYQTNSKTLIILKNIYKYFKYFKHYCLFGVMVMNRLAVTRLNDLKSEVEQLRKQFYQEKYGKKRL